MKFKLNKYAEELEEAFKEARTAYQKAESNLSDAEERRRKAEYFEEKFIGEKAAKIAYADEAIMQSWQNICDIADTLTGQANGQAERSYTLHMNEQWEQLVAPVIAEL